MAFLLPELTSTWGGFIGRPDEEYRPLLKVLAPPSGLAVSISDARDHLRVAGNDQDAKIARLVKAATGRIASYTRRALTPASYALDLWRFPYNRYGRVDLPMSPLRAVTAVKSAAGGGVFDTLNPAVYDVVTNSNGRGFVQLVYGQTWPSVTWGLGNASIEFDAGYLPGECPAELQQAILLIVGELYENASALSATPMSRLPDAVEALAGNYRVIRL